MTPDDTPHEAILRKAIKLLAFQAGTATPAEVELAAQRLGELLQAHDLTMQDVRTETLRHGIREERTRSGFARRPLWVGRLARGVAEACACMCTFSQDVSERLSLTPAEIFIGHEADVAVARYFYDVLLQQLPPMARQHVRDLPTKDRRRAKTSFLVGIEYAVAQRLGALLQPVPAGPPIGPTALSQPLVLAKRQAIMAHLEDTRPDLRQARHRQLHRDDLDMAAVRAGIVAGRTVVLHHGVRQAIQPMAIACG